jgi:hypothetical protein
MPAGTRRTAMGLRRPPAGTWRRQRVSPGRRALPPVIRPLGGSAYRRSAVTVNAVWRPFSVSTDRAERCQTLADETHLPASPRAIRRFRLLSASFRQSAKSPEFRRHAHELRAAMTATAQRCRRRPGDGDLLARAALVVWGIWSNRKVGSIVRGVQQPPHACADKHLPGAARMNLDGEIGVRHGYTPPAIGSFLEEIDD